MTWFDRIKKFYDTNLWPIEWVKDAVTVGKITPEQYTEITNEPY